MNTEPQHHVETAQWLVDLATSRDPAPVLPAFQAWAMEPAVNPFVQSYYNPWAGHYYYADPYMWHVYCSTTQTNSA